MKEEVVKKPLKHMLWQAYNVRASYTQLSRKRITTLKNTAQLRKLHIQ